MSRGFVREDDQEEAPFIAPRAALPAGATNYVTPRGMQLLRSERDQLERQRTQLQGSDDELRRERTVINGKLDLLNERIASARLVEPDGAPPTEVRFGTTVTFAFRNGPQAGKQRSFTIVGVDEADVNENRIAFTAPITRALLGKRIGQVAEFPLGATVQELAIEGIG
ncbi:MAG: GreA/GreB family elongation factor [Flavobacteriales bacterium]|nr:GreA/GreB family elongation factor [Flavobacteriales bacterium]